MSDIFSFSGSEQNKTEIQERTAAAGSRSQEEAARAQAEERKKAQEKYLAMQGYEQFRQSLTASATNEVKSKQLQAELSAAEKSRAKYEEMWTKASNAAQREWSKKNNKLVEQAEIECAAYKRQAEAKKAGRAQDAAQREREVRNQLQKTENARQQLLKNKEIYQNNLNTVNNKTGKLACDTSVKEFMADSSQKGMLSDTQKNMCTMPIGQFCQNWASTPAALQQLEKKFLETAFCGNLRDFKASKKALPKMQMIWQLIVTAVFLLLVFIDYQFDSGILNYAEVPVILAYIMVIGYVVLSVPAYFLTKDNNGRLWGLVGMAAGAVWFFVGGVYNTTLGSKVLPIVVQTVIAGFLPRILISLFWAWIGNSSGVMNDELKSFFKNAENYERENNPKLKLRAGEMDAMIVCYVRHDELAAFLVRADSSQKAAQYNRELQETDVQLKKCEEMKQQLNRRLQEVNGLRTANRQQDAEDEKWLQQKTEEVYRKYGISGMPDFQRRGNLLSSDIQTLTEAERQLHIPASSTSTKYAALVALGQQFEGAKRRVRQLDQNSIACARTMKEWYQSDMLPPLEQKFAAGNAANVVYYHSIGDTLCLCTQAVQADPRKIPLLIKHNGEPITVPQAAEGMDAVHVTNIIREFWKAWTKNAPAELLRMGLLDPAGMVSMHYKGWTSQTRLEFTEYAHAEVVPGQNNEISCLFDPRLIREYDDAFGRQIQECQEYFSRNVGAIRQIQGDESNFEKMNQFRMHDSSKPVPMPYYVTFIIVPEGQESGAFVQGPHECMKNMSNIIENGMCREYGYIPILIYAENNVAKNWIRMTERAMAKGTAVRL